ncbi:MAG: hypothetical protein KTR25_09670 [Myxococcales bacterium]|nr:hypothetical protein [Myxococcales bacterium]
MTTSSIRPCIFTPVALDSKPAYKNNSPALNPKGRPIGPSLSPSDDLSAEYFDGRYPSSVASAQYGLFSWVPSTKSPSQTTVTGPNRPAAQTTMSSEVVQSEAPSAMDTALGTQSASVVLKALTSIEYPQDSQQNYTSIFFGYQDCKERCREVYKTANEECRGLATPAERVLCWANAAAEFLSCVHECK